jgi:hypothetical protein
MNARLVSRSGWGVVGNEVGEKVGEVSIDAAPY